MGNNEGLVGEAWSKWYDTQSSAPSSSGRTKIYGLEDVQRASNAKLGRSGLAYGSARYPSWKKEAVQSPFARKEVLSKEDVAEISAWQKKNRPPAPTAKGVYNRYSSFSPAQNKEALGRIKDMESSNAIMGRLGVREQGKELGKRVLGELPVVGGFLRGTGMVKGFTGNTRTGRAARTVTDLATAGTLGGPLASIAVGGVADLISDAVWPNKPLYEGGFTGNEKITDRFKYDQGSKTMRRLGYWDK